MIRPALLCVLLVGCDTPILHACDEEVPTFYAGEGRVIPTYDMTGRASHPEMDDIINRVQNECLVLNSCFDNLDIMIYGKPIPWNEYGETTTVMGYFDPNLWNIAVVLLPEMESMYETAFEHELGHMAEACMGLECNK